MIKMQPVWLGIKDSIKENFRYATLNFIFIVAFINVFQLVFGAENSIVGVIFTIMMSASMLRDLTAAPLKHLCLQAIVLVLMAAAACFVSSSDPLVAFPVNLAMIFFILYAYTYEYVSHLYFPYILSYLFLVFISPIQPAQLPTRLLGMCVGAVSIILYQLFMGRKRIVETAHDVLTTMMDHADECIEGLLAGEPVLQDKEQMHSDLCKLSQIVYERRKKVLCISDASFAMIDSGRGLENLILLLHETKLPLTPQDALLLQKITEQLSVFRDFMKKKADTIPPLKREDFCCATAKAENLYQCLVYIRDHLIRMTLPQEKSRYRKTRLSFSVRLKAALNASPVRVTYALRVSCLLALCTLLVQELQLPHGRWLLFTVASVSLPYADDVGSKAKKRFLATAIGATVGVVLYSLIPSPIGRTAVMMASGYLTFYFTDYSATFACSTVGALGGAIFTDSFGWGAVGEMIAIRLGYILAGIAIALLANCLLFPFKRKKATEQLWKKYVSTVDLLTRVCADEQIDPQLYYSLVIQAHLLEEKLSDNAKDLQWEEAQDILEQCRHKIRQAHRNRAAGRQSKALQAVSQE